MSDQRPLKGGNRQTDPKIRPITSFFHRTPSSAQRQHMPAQQTPATVPHPPPQRTVVSHPVLVDYSDDSDDDVSIQQEVPAPAQGRADHWRANGDLPRFQKRRRSRLPKQRRVREKQHAVSIYEHVRKLQASLAMAQDQRRKAQHKKRGPKCAWEPFHKIIVLEAAEKYKVGPDFKGLKCGMTYTDLLAHLKNEHKCFERDFKSRP